MNKDKILKILIIIIFTIFFLLGCSTIYKFVIINKIFNKMQEYVGLENYYMKIVESETDEAMEVLYKDGIGKYIISSEIYTWTDGTEAYLVNEKKKQIQEVGFNDSTILISNEYVGSMIPGYSKTEVERFVLAGNITTSVKYKNYDGVKYYIITTDDGEQRKTVWFKYDSLLPTQVNVEIGDYKKSFNYDITFKKVRDEEVKKPNVEEYELITSE